VVTTRHLEGAIVETVYRGHCGVRLVESVARDAPAILASVPGTCWLLDMRASNGVDAVCSQFGVEIFRAFRARQGRAFAVVLRSGPLRMMVTAAAFASGLPLRVFERRQEALVFLRAESASAPLRAAF
jgi:hypothetical protein